MAWHACACRALLICEVACSLDTTMEDFSFHVSVFSDQLVLDVDHSRRLRNMFHEQHVFCNPFKCFHCLNFCVEEGMLTSNYLQSDWFFHIYGSLCSGNLAICSAALGDFCGRWE